MKKYVIILALALFQFSSSAQDLISKYKTGTVKLVPDTEFAQGNDWNTVFRSYYDTLYNRPMGMRKSLVVLPDGSVIVNHAYRNYRTKFSPSGAYKKEFELEKAGHKAVMGVINGNTLFTGLNNMGKMTCTDFDGKYKKTLTLDYMTKDIIALNNGSFAVVGWVLWAEKIRSFVAIVDYETNEEKVIWEDFIDRNISSSGKHLNNRQPFNYQATLKGGGMVSYTTMPYSKSTGKGLPPQIATVNNELLVAIPNTGELFVYDLNGNLKSKTKVNWGNNTISIEEQKAIQQKAIQRYQTYLESGEEMVQKNRDAFKQIIVEMQNDLQKINTPLEKPSFSNIIKDSDGNILFFEIPAEKDANVFHVWVYNQGGKFVAKCQFVCDEYELNISASKMVFHNGYIYSLQRLKEAKGNPLRLVRFKVAGA